MPEPTLEPITARLSIDGGWSGASDGRTQTAKSPASGEVIGSFPLADAADVDRAVAAAAAAWPEWSGRTVFDRTALLRRLQEEIDGRRERFALLLALEQGKPLREAMGEIDFALAVLDAAIAAGNLLEGAMPPSEDPHKRIFVYRVSRGVVAAIQPWNYPLSIAVGQLGPALAAGNTVVSLAAPTTSLIAQELAACILAVDLPPGVCNNLTGLGAEIGDRLVSHPDVRAIAFTGSTATGRRIAREGAGKAQLLELGGNGPLVILEDAPMDLAVPATVASCFHNAGQMCTAAERILVQESIHDEFAEQLLGAVRDQIRVGDPRDPTTTMGPLNNEQTATKMERHLEDALAKGASVALGGARVGGFPTDLYFEPTVLTGVAPEMEVAVEETFGPIAPLERFEVESEVLHALDRSDYGLAASIFTRDLGRGLRLAERFPAGVVNINEGTPWAELSAPFGGRAGKGSGSGRTHPRFGIEGTYTEAKTVCLHLPDRSSGES